MTTLPNPRTWVDKEIPPYDEFNSEIYDTLMFLLKPPMIKIRQSSAQSIPNNTNTALTWQAEDVDPYNWHNQTVNPTRITPTFPGWYRGWFTVGFGSTNAGNFRLGHIQKNGSANYSRRDSRPSISGYTKRLAGVPFFVSMNGTTDYVEVVVLQDSGAAMNTNVATNSQSEVFMRYWMPL